MTDLALVLIAGRWQTSSGTDSFTVSNPTTGDSLGTYPVSPWDEVAAVLAAGHAAVEALADLDEAVLPRFLDLLADRLEARAGQLVAMAHQETGLPSAPRLADVELPRTTDQLRQAGAAARARTWKRPVLSPRARISSMFAPIPGAVIVFGPNNFPFAFNSIAGGDFAAAVATGHPIIGKANPGHPGTTRLLAEEALSAATEAGLPPGFIQLIYRTSHADGARLVADDRVAATAYTGSRRAGLGLKAAADAAGRPIYLEMSSVNPVVVLPQSCAERGDTVVTELATSMLAATGQFCTSPGLVFALAGAGTDKLRAGLKSELEAAPTGTLLGETVLAGLVEAAGTWTQAGAVLAAQAQTPPGPRCAYPNSMMVASGQAFLARPDMLQAEAFGNLSLLVECVDLDELLACVQHLEGNLTGTIYSASDGSDDAMYDLVAPILRSRVGRLLNDKAPTGVAVVPSMNHGGPYPATGHAGFTAVGIPGSLERFAMLQCFDNVRDHRLPPELQAANPLGLVRLVDGEFTAAVIEWG